MYTMQVVVAQEVIPIPLLPQNALSAREVFIMGPEKEVIRQPLHLEVIQVLEVEFPQREEIITLVLEEVEVLSLGVI
jgi:hypothetical protein